MIVGLKRSKKNVFHVPLFFIVESLVPNRSLTLDVPESGLHGNSRRIQTETPSILSDDVFTAALRVVVTLLTFDFPHPPSGLQKKKTWTQAGERAAI